MAYTLDDEDLLAQQQASGAGVQTSAQSATIAPGQQNASKGPKNPDKPGNFVGIQQYLQANKPQAEKLGTQTANVVENQVQQGQSAINELQNQANTQIQPTQKLNQEIVNKINTTPEALSQQERDLAKKTSQAQYKGPAAVTDLGQSYEEAYNKSKQAEQALESTQTEEGRKGLVTQVNQKPRTIGMNLLDSALLQSGGGREKLATVAEQNQGFKGSFDTTKQNIQNQIGRLDDPSTPDIDESMGAIGQTKQAQVESSKAINDALNKWKTGFLGQNIVDNPDTPNINEQEAADLQGLNGKKAQLERQIINEQNRINPQLSGTELDQDVLDLLGLQEGTNIFDLDLGSYLSPSDISNITNNTIATPEDFARYAALAELSGDKSGLLDLKNQALANSAPKSAYSKQAGKDLASDIRSKSAEHVVKQLETIPVNQFGFSGQFGGETYDSLKNNVLPKLKQDLAAYIRIDPDLAAGISQSINEVNTIISSIDNDNSVLFKDAPKVKLKK